MAEHTGEIYPLHVGDTWLEPAKGCRMQDLEVDRFPGLHRYAPPSGLPELVEALVAQGRDSTGLPLEPSNVQVTAGATGGLAALMGALLEPGDEVMILAPYWPLIEGIVRVARGVPVIIPFLGEADDPLTAVEAVERHRTDRTVALYFGSPNNPTGRVIPGEWIEDLVAWAARHDLWVVADEVYSNHVWEEPESVSPPTLTLDPERTFSVHSFSKSFGMAGNRVGWLLGPDHVMPTVAKVATHLFYSTPTAGQVAALRLLDGRGARWLEESRRLYRDLGQRAAARLGVPAPQGSTFLFLDVAHRTDERGLMGFLEDCAEDGLFLAPGPSFGPYPDHVRVCYTATLPEITMRGIEVLARHLGV